MPKLGALDADTPALEARLSSHDKFSTRDLNAWVLERLPLFEGARVLDLGCGAGRQSLPIAERIGAGGGVVGIDASEAATGRLSAQAAEKGLSDRIETLCLGLDDVPEALAGRRFDIVTSCYAFYYAEQPRALVRFVAEALRPSGTFFVCGPATNNNTELKELVAEASGVAPEPSVAAIVLHDECLPECRDQFADVTTEVFENGMRFETVDDLLDYWRNHNLYDAALEQAVAERARAWFDTHPVFTLGKRAIAIRASHGSRAT